MAHESLFIAAFVYLLAAVVSVPIAKKCGLSSVLGYLVAGVLIGPFVLKLVGEEGADVMNFAEFGVILMLFLVGLELQPALLWRLRGLIVGLGGVQVIATTAVIAGVALLLGLNWQAAVGLGMALSLSSTAIALQYLQEKGLSKTAGGQSAFSILLFQDIAVIPMLAVFPLLGSAALGGGTPSSGNAFQDWLAGEPAWVSTLLTLGAVVGIILAGRYLFQPLMALVARTRVRETFVALGLLLVIGVALLMTQLGVSPAMGTFLAGVVLANSEYRHELEADIEPFKGILLGVFFISVGAAIDFGLIAERPLMVAGLVLGLVALKALVLYGVGILGKLGRDQRMMQSFALAQGGEFTFVLAGLGFSGGVFTSELAQLLVAGAAVSMGLTPIFLLLDEKLLRPKLGPKEESRPSPNVENEEAPVILAGVGRFGNYVARLLRSQDVTVTVIDDDPDYIEFLRQLGIKAFYGDAVRHDLLEAAGAAEAQLLIIALDREENTNRLVELARRHYPQLKIMARALSRPHQYELLRAEVDYSVHQHVGSAMQLGEEALRLLGFRSFRAARLAKKLAAHDRETIELLADVQKDEKVYVSRSRERIADLKKQFQSDRERHGQMVDGAWDVEQLRSDLQEQNSPQPPSEPHG